MGEIAPSTIWLQWGEWDDDYNDSVTWCEDRVDGTDVRYIRSDIADVLQDACEMAVSKLIDGGCVCGAHETIVPMLRAAIAKAKAG